MANRHRRRTISVPGAAFVVALLAVLQGGPAAWGEEEETLPPQDLVREYLPSFAHVEIALRYDDEASAARAFEAIARGALSDPIENATRVRSATAEAGQKAARVGRHCSERELRGPFAVVRSGRDLGVTLGPYVRDNRTTRSAANCATALPWAASISKAQISDKAKK